MFRNRLSMLSCATKISLLVRLQYMLLHVTVCVPLCKQKCKVFG